MNAAAAHRLPITSLPSRTWYRAVDPALASAPPRPSVGVTRFNDGPSGSPGYRLVYFAPDPITALYEVEALLGSVFSFTVPNPFRGAVVTRHTAPPLDVVDLGDPANRSLVDTTRQELTGDWRAYRQPQAAPAPTQALARAVHQASSATHGILAPSARNPYVNNLIVFYDRVSQEP